MARNRLIDSIGFVVTLGMMMLSSSVMCVGKGYRRALYVCHYTDSEIHIDGKLDEPSWRGAAKTNAFSRFGSKDETVLYPTRAMMLWDKENLYIAFLCSDPDIWATLVNRDAPIFEEEVVEVYLDPDGDGENYLELEVNPRNTVTDIFMNKPYSEGGKADWKWNLESFQSVVTVDGTLNNPKDVDRGWQVEMAIPWRNFRKFSPDIALPPKPGDKWRINLYRIERMRVGETREELTAWSPINTFHAPQRFGVVQFSTAK